MNTTEFGAIDQIFKKRWFSVDEVALYLGLSKHTIYEKVECGLIPFTRIPHSNRIRFDRLVIDNWLMKGA